MAVPRGLPQRICMAAHNLFGQAAEDLAADVLRRSGWRILNRNWRWSRLELDIVGRRGDLVAFIEVRARRSLRLGHPLDTISWRKRRDLQTAALAWTLAYGRPGDHYRFDAIWVHAPAGDVTRATVQHVEDAWTL